jgi:hypothetical protein
MAFTVPTIDDFKDAFDRDFPFDPDMNKGVRDKDITNAINDASYAINEGLFSEQAIYTRAFLLLAAHSLVTNLRNSSKGLAGGFSWLTSSKGVGSVSESYSIPDQVLQNPYLGLLAKTSYGARYLEMVAPLLAGNIAIVGGGTQA